MIELNTLTLFCFSTASLAHFFQMTQEEGMIFEWYGNFLDRIPPFIASPLGRCVLCNGFWIYSIAYFILTHFSESKPRNFGDSTQMEIVLFFCGVGLNFFFTRVIDKIISQHE